MQMSTTHSSFDQYCISHKTISHRAAAAPGPQVHPECIGVDLAGLLGGHMASAESGSVSSGVAYGEGCPLSSRLRGLGERRELPQRGPGRKRILAYFEGHRTLIFVHI